MNKRPFGILGVAPPELHGTLVGFYPDFFVPMVNQEQVEGWSGLNNRRNRWIFTVMGHLKAGVTPEQAISDLNSIGADLEKSYPKEDGGMSFTLAPPGLYGDFFGRPIRAFLMGLTLLAGLVLLFPCSPLCRFFSPRPAGRLQEGVLRRPLPAA